MSDATKPTEHREQERRKDKAHGRDRRAELLLDTKAKEAARQDVLEGRVERLDTRLAQVEQRLAVLEDRASQPAPKPAPASSPTPTPNP
jgi:hypothetical protein